MLGRETAASMEITESELIELICAVYWCSKIKRPHWFKFSTPKSFHQVCKELAWHSRPQRATPWKRDSWRKWTFLAGTRHGLWKGTLDVCGARLGATAVRCGLSGTRGFCLRNWVSEKELRLGWGGGGEFRMVKKTAGVGTRRAQQAPWKAANKGHYSRTFQPPRARPDLRRGGPPGVAHTGVWDTQSWALKA